MSSRGTHEHHKNQQYVQNVNHLIGIRKDKMSPKKLPNLRLLNKLFSYDKRTGLLIRKIHVWSAAKTKPGDIAGSYDSLGYRKVSIDRETYCVHRLIWKMNYGDIPQGKYIDHINGVKDDNRLKNLRLVTKSGNSKNLKKTIKNTSGVCGVSWCKLTKSWRVDIGSKGKKIRLGSFKSKREAVRVRKLAEIKYNFSKNHGKRIK